MYQGQHLNFRIYDRNHKHHPMIGDLAQYAHCAQIVDIELKSQIQIFGSIEKIPIEVVKKIVANKISEDIVHDLTLRDIEEFDNEWRGRYEYRFNLYSNPLDIKGIVSENDDLTIQNQLLQDRWSNLVLTTKDMLTLVAVSIGTFVLKTLIDLF